MEETTVKSTQEIPFDVFKNEVLEDYKLAHISRELSLLGRKEVLTGKAKFGIFGDGKELAQLALAKQFKEGDFRSGYYRDQTLMMAIGHLTPEQFFAGLYADTDLNNEPFSGGRQMGGHFSTQNINPDGSWKNLMHQKNSSADASPTASQMPRLLGLALASKLYRQNKDLQEFTQFSNNGNEVAFGTIGDASTSEGLFFETINAAGVLQVPMVMSVWDDGHGISVPKSYQTTKESISEVLKGFEEDKNSNGYKIYKVKGWDYPALCQTYLEAVEYTRKHHTPALIHVEEVTQPQGHSTSGSHERYKSKERLEWEKEYDCIAQFKKWILDYPKDFGNPIAIESELDTIENEAKKIVREAKKIAWDNYLTPINQEKKEALDLIEQLANESAQQNAIQKIIEHLSNANPPQRKDIFEALKKAIRFTFSENLSTQATIKAWLTKQNKLNQTRYNGLLFDESSKSVLNVTPIEPQYDTNPEVVDGRLILRNNFDKLFEKNPLLLMFGEDTGNIGGVNQSMEGMQEKYGELRVTDTGIREATIVGQGIGLALRGLKPIAEIQYLDYLLYAIQILSDDLATLHYRTKGTQKAPLIVSTRGHRLEGIWHSGSPMGMIIHSLRGMHVCVPRNMTKAAGMYNTLLASEDPALVVEPLNGYRSKELLPNNIGEYKIPLGIPEITKEGNDLTIVSYGSTFNLCSQAAVELSSLGIEVELIDVQTLLPFDVHHIISTSLAKTNKLLIVDEDVPGGASGFILDKILIEQNGFEHLDAKPITLTAKEHRPAYGTDGDYFSKPNIEDIVDRAYQIMHEYNPSKYPSI